MLGPGGGGQEDTIPSIITNECSSDSPSHSHQVLSSALLLSPQCPHSPTYFPPSTLHDKLEEKSGLSSIGLLNPDSFSRRHQGSTSLTANVARSDDIHHSHFNTISVMNVDHLPQSPTSDIVKDGQTTHQTEHVHDAAIDAAPFRFKPYELAHMLDPKSIETLVGFGGVDGLLRGLGTNADTGLVINA